MISIIATVGKRRDKDYPLLNLNEAAVPWCLPNNIEHLKKITRGDSVVMDEHAWNSTSKASLVSPGQVNIVCLTSRGTGNIDVPEGCEVFYDWYKAVRADATGSSRVVVFNKNKWEDLLKLTTMEVEFFFIGGEKLCSKAFPHARKLYLTKIDASFSEKASFPLVQPEDWNDPIHEEHHEAGPGNNYDYSFVIYKRQNTNGAI